MRLLLDNCLSPIIGHALVEAGHDVDWTGSWGPDPGDAEILTRAKQDDRVLVTLDRGIGQRAKRQLHSGVILIVATRHSEHASAVLRGIREHAGDLLAGALVIVRPDRIRLSRRLPDA